MAGVFWIGTRGHENWMTMFASPATFPKMGYTAQQAYLNGGASVQGSIGGHREYNMAWSPTKKRDELRFISDLADGIYDTTEGTNLIYFIDPVAADKNVLPQSWAFPAQGGRDAVPLVTTAAGPMRPTLANTPVNALGYPVRSAVYTLVGTETTRALYLPIPPGFVAWVSAAGTTSGPGVQVTPFNASFPGTVTALTLLSVTNPAVLNYSFSSTAYTGIEIALTVAAGTLTLSGMIVQMLPVGVTPNATRFISGQGHSGCEFFGKPVQTPYQVAPNGQEAIGMTAVLVETGDSL